MENTVTSNIKNVVDIQMPGVGKKKYRINGDDNMVISLNTSDFNIVSRLDEAYPKLQEAAKRAADIEIEQKESEEKQETDTVNRFAAKLREIDKDMKEFVDYIFDSNVSEVCAGNASMYDILDTGDMRFEVIIRCLTELYGDTITTRAKKMQDRSKQYISKHIKK